MGGYGSTRWNGHEKAIQIEDCVILDATTFRKNWKTHRAFTAGTLIWQTGSYTSYMLTRETSKAHLTIRFDARGTGTPSDAFDLIPTRPNYGGQRWWFRCPSCDGRVRKLFLPPGGSSFGCRHCHRLTYRSCQESHSAFSEIRRLLRLAHSGQSSG